jgi:hypothetical protein
LSQSADQAHDAEQNDLDRQQQSASQAADIDNQQKIVRMRPAIGR